MNCTWTRRNIDSYIDGELSAAAQRLLRLHLRFCPECFEAYDRRESMTTLTSRLGPTVPPPELRTQIKIAVSYEAARKGFWDWERFRDRARTMLRPLAIPALGGVLSALILLGGLMQDLGATPQLFLDDVPLLYVAQAPEVEQLSPYAVRHDTVVLVFIDRSGDIYDFDLPEEPHASPELRAELANSLLFTRFQPAMRFGSPVSSTMLIQFTRTTVRG
jgi:hypothetical protein